MLSCGKDGGSTKDDSRVVDLGLSVKWASCNIGATTPSGSGGFYAWGEVEEKATYSKSNYSSGSVDIATAKWGAPWRMPTLAEWEELLERCTWKIVSKGGIYGCEFTGPNGNTIFLPAAGWKTDDKYIYPGADCIYWSATLCEDKTKAFLFYFGQDHIKETWEGEVPFTSYNPRYAGYSVRAVQ